MGGECVFAVGSGSAGDRACETDGGVAVARRLDYGRILVGRRIVFEHERSGWANDVSARVPTRVKQKGPWRVLIEN